MQSHLILRYATNVNFPVSKFIEIKLCCCWNHVHWMIGICVISLLTTFCTSCRPGKLGSLKLKYGFKKCRKIYYAFLRRLISNNSSTFTRVSCEIECSMNVDFFHECIPLYHVVWRVLYVGFDQSFLFSILLISRYNYAKEAWKTA